MADIIEFGSPAPPSFMSDPFSRAGEVRISGTSPPGFDVPLRGTHVSPAPSKVAPNPPIPKPVALPVPSELCPKFEVDMSLPEPSSSTAPSPPDLVKATYVDDLNIHKIHDALRELYSFKLGNLDRIEEEVEALKNKLSTGYLSLIEADQINAQISKLITELNEIETGEKWEKYVAEAKPIMERYAELASDETRGIVKFVGDTSKSAEDPARVETRHALIEMYLKIAAKHITLDIVREVSREFRCPGCGGDVTDMILDEDEGLRICPCGFQQANMIKISTFKDSMRVNVGGRSGYEDRSTFIRCYDRYMGSKIPKIPDRLYTMLDRYLTSQGFPSGDYIKNHVPLLENGKKAGTSVDLMIKALGATQNAFYYDCTRWIAANYWGWALPDLSALRDTIINDYDVTQKVYEVKRERGSSLNVQVRLYLHLCARDYPCDFTDFKILTSRESLEYHHRMWKLMCDATGLKFTPVI